MLMTDEKFGGLCDEMDELIAHLRSLSAEARRRSKRAVVDGYPRRSMGDAGSRGGTADPTAAAVLSIAGGNDDRADHWHGPPDPVRAAVARMDMEVIDARNRLRTALSSVRLALPERLATPSREQCVDCGALKSVITDHGRNRRAWIVGEGRCDTCHRRMSRHGKGARRA